MSAIVEFPLERARLSGYAAPTLAGEVVIFPGVRIERREFSLSDRLDPRRRPARRAAEQPALEE